MMAQRMVEVRFHASDAMQRELIRLSGGDLRRNGVVFRRALSKVLRRQAYDVDAIRYDDLKPVQRDVPEHLFERLKSRAVRRGTEAKYLRAAMAMAVESLRNAPAASPAPASMASDEAPPVTAAGLERFRTYMAACGTGAVRHLARKAGASPATISRILSGERSPSLEMRRRIAEATADEMTVEDWSAKK